MTGRVVISSTDQMIYSVFFEFPHLPLIKETKVSANCTVVFPRYFAALC